jgi:small subunit ribosomal protein S11
MMVKDTKSVKKKKIKRSIVNAQLHVLATFNNTIVCLTDDQGNVLSTSSSGACGFKGARKGTPYAAQVASEKVLSVVKDYQIKNVSVFVKGIGSGRESAIRGIQNNGIEVLSITDVTPVAHNGCRPKKVRRV